MEGEQSKTRKGTTPYSQSIEGEFAGGRDHRLSYTVLLDHTSSLSRLIESVALARKGPLSPADPFSHFSPRSHLSRNTSGIYFKRILHI